MQHEKNEEARVFESVHFWRSISSKKKVNPTNNAWQSEKQMSLWIKNKINYVRQHYLSLLIHKTTYFDQSVGHLQVYKAD